MKLHEMLPHECEKALKERWPVFLPIGTLEYHGEHLPLGVDAIAVISALDELEKRKDCIIASPVWYGPSSYAVAGPEKGTIDVDTDRFEKHIFDILKGLLLNGFRKIFVVIHHQFEEGRYMPAAVACKKAAMTLIFETLERERGRGWWGDSKMSRYYEEMDTVENPFRWIEVVPLMSPEIQHDRGYDHAGKLETSLMLAAVPERVEMKRLKGDGLWFTKDASKATKAHGEKTIEDIVNYLTSIAWQ